MSLTNYSDLQQAIANFITRDDLTSYIPDFIALAESRIAADLNTSELHVTTTLTVDSASEVLPTNFKGMVRIKLDGTYPPLDYINSDHFHGLYASNVTGRPIAYTIEGNDIYFAPSPDTTYTATYTYIQKPDLATDTTNRLMTINPDLYLYASLIYAADFIHDDDLLAKYEGRYRAIIMSMNASDQNKGALAMFVSDIP